MGGGTTKACSTRALKGAGKLRSSPSFSISSTIPVPVPVPSPVIAPISVPPSIPVSVPASVPVPVSVPASVSVAPSPVPATIAGGRGGRGPFGWCPTQRHRGKFHRKYCQPRMARQNIHNNKNKITTTHTNTHRNKTHKKQT